MKDSYVYIFVFVFVFYKTDSPLGITFTPQSLCQLSELVTSVTSLSKCFQLSVLLPPQTSPVRENLSLSLLPSRGRPVELGKPPALLLFVSLLLLSLSLDLLLSYFRLGASSMHV